MPGAYADPHDLEEAQSTLESHGRHAQGVAEGAGHPEERQKAEQTAAQYRAYDNVLEDLHREAVDRRQDSPELLQGQIRWWFDVEADGGGRQRAGRVDAPGRGARAAGNRAARHPIPGPAGDAEGAAPAGVG